MQILRAVFPDSDFYSISRVVLLHWNEEMYLKVTRNLRFAEEKDEKYRI